MATIPEGKSTGSYGKKYESCLTFGSKQSQLEIQNLAHRTAFTGPTCITAYVLSKKLENGGSDADGSYSRFKENIVEFFLIKFNKVSAEKAIKDGLVKRPKDGTIEPKAATVPGILQTQKCFKFPIPQKHILQ